MGFLDSDMSFVGSEPHTRLKKALIGMKDELDKFTDSFNKVHSMRAADTYVEPTVWTEAIAPVYKPFPRVKVGPSGAGMPLVHLLFCRNFLGDNHYYTIRLSKSGVFNEPNFVFYSYAKINLQYGN